MKSIFKILTCGILCSLAHSAALHAGDATPAPVKASKNDIEVEIFVPGPISNGGPAKLKVRLVNKGKTRVNFEDINNVSEFGIEVLDTRGVSPEKTEKGKYLLGKIEMASLYIIVPLAPGQSLEYTIDLRECYKLSPGKYTVSVTLRFNRFGDSFEISAKGAEFTVQ